MLYLLRRTLGDIVYRLTNEDVEKLKEATKFKSKHKKVYGKQNVCECGFTAYYDCINCPVCGKKWSK
jgi:lipopolysaccharide biosynthesis regulator YciM